MSEKMRIGVLAPPWNKVPPDNYGGTERIVDILCRGYAAAGHEPILFASGDSTTPVQHEHIIAEARMPPDKYQEHVHLAHFIKRANELSLDMVHSHLEAIQPYAGMLPCPVVCTMHVEITSERERFLRRNKAVHYVSISRNHSQKFPMPVEFIRHGLEIEKFPCTEEADHYLFFIGEISERKGADTAARVARELGIPLKIAGPVKPGTELWFEREVIGLGSGMEIQHLGPLGFEDKVALMGRAMAVLCPVRWDEPFGLVAVEAMACGTPVVAMARGSFPELIEDGVTGFLCENEDEFLDKVPQTRELDRFCCHDRMLELFDHQRMVDEYLTLFVRLLNS